MEIPLADNKIIRIHLKRRHIKVLLILNQALQVEKDGEIDEASWVWLTDKQIAEAYASDDPLAFPPNPSAITSYRSQINGLIKKALKKEKISSTQEPPRLFISERDVVELFTVLIKVVIKDKYDFTVSSLARTGQSFAFHFTIIVPRTLICLTFCLN